MENVERELFKEVKHNLGEIGDLMAEALETINNYEDNIRQLLKGTLTDLPKETEYKHLCQYCQNKVSELEYIMNNMGNKFVFHVCSNKCWAILRVVLEMQGYKFSERDQQIYEGKI